MKEPASDPQPIGRRLAGAARLRPERLQTALETARHPLVPFTGHAAGRRSSPLLRHQGRGRSRPQEVIVINKYELMLMLHPETEEERQAEIQARVRSTVEAGKGTIVGLDDWGRKKLAYEIERQTEGIYSIHTFTADPETLAEVERQLSITDEVMRFMTTRPPIRSPKPE